MAALLSICPLVSTAYGATDGGDPPRNSSADNLRAAAQRIAVLDAKAEYEKHRRFSKSIPRATFADVNGWKMIAHVCLQNDLSSELCRPGDPVWGLLDDDCKWGAKLVAARDSLIKGHIVDASAARTLANAALSSDRRLHSGGALSIQFDEIVDQDGNSWPICGKLCRIRNVDSSSNGAPRLVQVDKKGTVVNAGPTLTDKEKNIFLAGHLATSAPIPGTFLLNLLAAPVVMSVAGAAYPAFAFDRPVDMKEPGIRKKAFVYGFLTGLPGAGVVQACVQKGSKIDMKAGDQLIVDFCFQENEFCSKGRIDVSGVLMKPEADTAHQNPPNADPKNAAQRNPNSQNIAPKAPALQKLDPKSDVY